MIFRAVLAIAVLFFSVPAFAADPVPGNSCSGITTHSFQWAGGPENGGVVNGMFCESSTWQGVINFQSSGGKCRHRQHSAWRFARHRQGASTLGTMRLEGNTSGYAQIQPRRRRDRGR